MNEAKLLGEVLGLADEWDVLVFHNPDSRRVTNRGFPDLVLVGHKGILYRELKSSIGRLSQAQWFHGYRILAAGGDWGTWRPRDWRDGTIHAQLAVIA